MGTISNPLPGTFTYNELSDEQLGLGSTVGTAFSRRAGIYNVAVTGVLTTADATISAGLVLYGSNNGTDWVEIAAMDAADRLQTTTVTTGCIAFSSGGVVPVGRFRYLQVQVEGANLAGNPWTMDVLVGGAQHPGEHFQVTPAQIVRGAATMVSDTVSRPRNVRMLTTQAVFSNVDIDGSGSFDIVAQMSVDGSEWATVNTATSVVANGAVVVPGVGGGVTLDWGGFNYMRFEISDNGVGATPTYTCNLLVDMDSKDWQAYESPTGGAGGGGGVLGARVDIPDVNFTLPGNAPIVVQVTDASGAPLAGNHNLVLVISDTRNAGDVDLAGMVQFDGVTAGAGVIVAGDNTNRCAVRTDATGRINLDIDDNGAGAGAIVWIHAESMGVPHPDGLGLVVAQSDQCRLEYL